MGANPRRRRNALKRKLRFVLALAALALVAYSAFGGARLSSAPIVLFNGVVAADSSEMASPWIPVRGASRIYIRTWSAGASADSATCDTITTWKTMFSDSVLFQARDSLGTIVTARAGFGWPWTNAGAFPMCADSVVISNAASDSVKLVANLHPVQGVGKPVRGSVTGSGYWTIICPIAVGGQMPIAGSTTSGVVMGHQEVIMAGYLRIRITPRTRLTTAGFSSTAGIRTKGINKLRMEAYLVYDNK
jgi:hypothetical protein